MSCLLIQLVGLFIRTRLAGAVRRPKDTHVKLSLVGPVSKWRLAILFHPQGPQTWSMALAVFILNTGCMARKPINCNEILGWEDAQDKTKSSE